MPGRKYPYGKRRGPAAEPPTATVVSLLDSLFSVPLLSVWLMSPQGVLFFQKYYFLNFILKISKRRIKLFFITQL
jgi:hypothetical protein